MKVLFTFGGLPHYYNAILNKLNNVDGLEIHVVVPETNFNTIGKGVYQTQEGIKFRLHSLPEYKTYYGKSFFRNFLKLVKNEKPEDDAIATLGKIFAEEQAESALKNDWVQDKNGQWQRKK